MKNLFKISACILSIHMVQACKVRSKAPQESIHNTPKTADTQTLGADAMVAAGPAFHLVDYDYNAENKKFNQTNDFKFAIQHSQLSFEEDLKRYDSIPKKAYQRQLSKQIIDNELAAYFKLADITPGGFVFDLNTRQVLSRPNAHCHSVAVDAYTGALFISDTHLVEPEMGLYGQEFALTVSGRLCLDQQGRISEYKNDGLFSIEECRAYKYLSNIREKGGFAYRAARASINWSLERV